MASTSMKLSSSNSILQSLGSLCFLLAWRSLVLSLLLQQSKLGNGPELFVCFLTSPSFFLSFLSLPFSSFPLPSSFFPFFLFARRSYFRSLTDIFPFRLASSQSNDGRNERCSSLNEQRMTSQPSVSVWQRNSRSQASVMQSAISIKNECLVFFLTWSQRMNAFECLNLLLKLIHKPKPADDLKMI